MNLENILEKIHQTPVPQGQKVAVAFSGGLDSSLAILIKGGVPIQLKYEDSLLKF